MKSHLALITILDERQGPVDPGFGVPGGGGGQPPHPWFPGHGGGAVDPGWGVRPPVDPGYGRPVMPPHVGGGPVYPPVYPTTGPVPTPPPVTPDNTLPETPDQPPPQVSLPIVLPPDIATDPERLFELKWTARYGWVLVPVEDDTAQPKKK
jgi:hypothetical protein